MGIALIVPASKTERNAIAAYRSAPNRGQYPFEGRMRETGMPRSQVRVWAASATSSVATSMKRTSTLFSHSAHQYNPDMTSRARPSIDSVPSNTMTGRPACGCGLAPGVDSIGALLDRRADNIPRSPRSSGSTSTVHLTKKYFIIDFHCGQAISDYALMIHSILGALSSV